MTKKEVDPFEILFVLAVGFALTMAAVAYFTVLDLDERCLEASPGSPKPICETKK